MIPNRVVMRVRESGDGLCWIDINGEMSAFAEDELMLAYDEVAATGARTVVLNFQNVSQMNSSGVALLARFAGWVTQNGHEVAACGLIPHYRRVFELTKLSGTIRVYDDGSDFTCESG